MATVIIKSGTTSISGATVKGNFSYFSGDTTHDLGPTSVTGLYSGVNAPDNGYTVYRIGGLNGWTARVATNTATLNSILISYGGTGSTVDQNITWATNTNSVWINSGTTVTPTSFSALYGGYYNQTSGVTEIMLSRYIISNSGATLDTTFSVGSGFNTSVGILTPSTGGKTYVGGQFTTFTGTSQIGLIRLNSDGSKDTGFNIGTGFDFFGDPGFSLVITVDENQKLYVGGAFDSYNGYSSRGMVKINTDGSADTSFSPGGNILGFPYAILPLGGKLYVGGDFTDYDTTTVNYIMRLNLDGSLDTSFNSGAGFDYAVYNIILDSNGKLYIGGGYTTYKGLTQNKLIRINQDGTKDTGFDIGTGFDGDVQTTVIDPTSGKIYVGGFFTTYKGLTQNRLIRLNTDGTKDSSFNIGTGFNLRVFTMALSPSGKLLVGGDFTSYNGTTVSKNVILNDDGTIFNGAITFNGVSPIDPANVTINTITTA